MPITRRSFFDLCMAGLARFEELGDFESRWRQEDGKSSLAEYLGFSEEEYALIVEKPKLLRYVINARKVGASLSQALHASGTDRAVGGASATQAKKLAVWLRKRDLLRAVKRGTRSLRALPRAPGGPTPSK